ATALEESRLAWAFDDVDDADVSAAATTGWYALQHLEHASVLRRAVRKVEVPCAPHAGLSAQLVDLQPGVFGERREPCSFEPGLSFQRGVVGIGLASLF